VAFVPDFFGQALNGLAYGVLLFLLSVGLTLIFGMLDIVNLAHGSYYMLGAYAGLTLISMTGNFWLALVLAPLGVGLLGDEATDQPEAQHDGGGHPNSGNHGDRLPEMFTP